MAEKRKRNPNFSNHEKSILLQCVSEEKNIVENKKTDGTTWKEKEQAWVRITNSFNALSGGACYRTTEALKKLYIVYKKDVRKEAAAEKFSALQTGGGNPYTVKDPNFDLAVTIMNPKTVHGLPNSFDSDSVQNLFINLVSDKENESPELENSVEDWSTYKPDQLRAPVSKKLKPNSLEVANDVHFGLKEEENATLPVKNSEKQGAKRCVENNWSTRRRPIAASLPSSKISEQYSLLSKIKTELVQLQLQAAKVESELKKKSLELDIQIKEELLKKIKNSTISNDDVDLLQLTKNII
ncbi:uncharacterized protein LOC129915671 [Episyrphus balteatus]|uniref:uncharacterized protein LOC129915671 n=1 Tax=Episyrphus balteatus TaxID=286459 RepID=UPI0024868A79|nr:uncharacterized protein LOC129915671 [Episyrphus balteatus]